MKDDKHVVTLRLSAEQHGLLKRQAHDADTSLNQYILDHLFPRVTEEGRPYETRELDRQPGSELP